jgi:probable HAF family extracellular repeat protein
MRTWVRELWRLTVVFGMLAGTSRADGLYSDTELGPAKPSAAYLSGNGQLDPSGNYLGLLSPADQAAFKAGSFDVFAHPATVTGLPTFYNRDILAPDYRSGVTALSSPYLVTANNVGNSAGISTETLPNLIGFSSRQLVVFSEQPHTLGDPSHPGQLLQSPGYLDSYITSNLPNFPFNGTVAGINDHRVVAATQSSGDGVQVPTLQGTAGSNWGTLVLGNLGGTNGVVNALNNASQVVGWSQVASGAQHAFLHSNGTMQDLNLLIPPISGITLITAVGIDDSGRIAAYGTDSSGRTEEFLLTPAAVPEPSSLAIFGLVILGFIARHRRSRRAMDS